MPGNPFTDANWPADVTDSIVRVVGKVRTRTTQPLVTAARRLVFGSLAGILAMFAAVLVVIIASRLVQALFDIWLRRSASVYVSYLVVGGILCLLGALVLRQRYSHD